MTREELKRLYVADSDRALAHPMIIGSDTVTRIKALRELIVTSDPTVEQLVTILQAQRATNETPPERYP